MARRRKMDPERKAFINSLLEHYQPKDAQDIQDMLKDLLGETLQGMLEAEMDDHLGYSKYDYKNKETDDSRNGYSPKTVTSSMGTIDLDIPRDRKGDFEPQIVNLSVLLRQKGVYYTTVDKWLRNYKAIGPEAFFRKGHTYRTPAQKKSAVFDYLSGKGSLRDICARHKISDAQILRRWIMKYNSHDKETGGRPIMTKGRKTTFEERVEIVQYCIKHSHNYSETAKKFHISYQQARSYTIKYEENGVDGLQDKRGKRKSPEEMTEVEKLRAEVRLLQAEKRRAEIEISFLKKLEEIERRGG